MSDIVESASLSSWLKMIDFSNLRKEIGCDCCEKVNPSKRCSRCRGAYYCSIECQKADWKNHKLVCQSCDDQIKSSNKNDLQSLLPPIPVPISQEQEADHGPCSICLQETMVDPVVLPDCRHAFCFSCLASWQKCSEQCPNCRESTKTSVIESALKNAMMYSNEERRLFMEKHGDDSHQKSNSSDSSDEKSTSSDFSDEQRTSSDASEETCTSLASEALVEKSTGTSNDASDENSASSNASDEKRTSSDLSVEINNEMANDSIVNTVDDRQNKYLNLALDQVNRVLLSNPNDFHALHIKGQILLEEDPAQALEFLDKALAIIEKNTAMHHSIPNAKKLVDMTEIVTIKLESCEAMQSLRKYSQALDIYKKLEQLVSKVKHQELQERLFCLIFIAESRCLLYMLEFQHAKHVAECGVKLNRRYPGMHVHLALALLGLGEKKDAVRTMCRAVLYEAPWDKKNQLENQQYLQRLIDSMKDKVYE